MLTFSDVEAGLVTSKKKTNGGWCPRGGGCPFIRGGSPLATSGVHPLHHWKRGWDGTPHPCIGGNQPPQKAERLHPPTQVDKQPRGSIYSYVKTFSSTFILLRVSWRSWRLSSASLFLHLRCWASSCTIDSSLWRSLIWSSKELQRRPLLCFLFGGRVVWTEPRENLERNPFKTIAP